MKKLLLLSLLVLFGCSKDSMESATSGNQIIGNYQIILQTSTDQEEFSFWDIRKEKPTSGFDVGAASNFSTTDLTGKLSFTSDFKGYFDIIVEDENIRVNFDWSYEGGKWYVIDENSEQWVINNSDRCVIDTYYCSGQPNTSSLYLMEKRRGYGTGDFTYYKLVF